MKKTASALSCASLVLLGVGRPEPSADVGVLEQAVGAPISTRVRDTGTAGHDWSQFGWDAARSSASAAPTGITAANVASLHRQQVTIDGTVDASAIYLAGVHVKDGTHDVVFVTTTYGKTVAIDANRGSVLWEFTPAGFATWAGTARITNSTPVADPSRMFVYAASPDGHVQKLAVTDGHVVWSTAVTLLADREKIASPLSLVGGGSSS